jgi:ADP-heptose:LPS heptosyltransferase
VPPAVAARNREFCRSVETCRSAIASWTSVMAAGSTIPISAGHWPTRAEFRKPATFYLACGSEVLRPCLRLYGHLCSRENPSSPGLWRRGLLLGGAHIGDLLYRTPSLNALKEGLPQCRWHYLTERSSGEVLSTHPAISATIDGMRTRLGSAEHSALARRLRAENFDVAICYDTGQYWPDLLLAIHAGIPNRVGYVHKGFSGLVTHPISICTPQPYPAYFRDLVAQLTSQTPNWPLRPVVVTQPDDEAEAVAVRHSLELSSHKPVLACFVTTRQPTGQWPRASYGQTLALLERQSGVQLVLCGAATDAPVLEELKEAHGLKCPILAGRLRLRSLVAFLRGCDGVFCADSGPRHLANAAGVPVFFMRNVWFDRVEAGPYVETEKDLGPEVERVTPGRETEAFRSVTPEGVAEVIAHRMALR